jgi:hypothetical protein
MVALAAGMAASPFLFGCNLVAALLRSYYAAGGDFRSAAILATLFVTAGCWQLGLGVRAALRHADPFNLWSFSLSLGSALAIVSYWHDAIVGLPPVNAAAAQVFFAALLSDCAVNIWLQVRGFLPRRRVHARAYSFDPAPPSFAAMIERQNEAIARLTIASRQAEAVLKLPGVSRAVLSTLHPDRFEAEPDKIAATGRFQTASVLLKKIGAR